MAADSSSGSYWPGFVDALTNVVIAMIFVIVVIAIALSFAMQLIVKKAAEQVSQAEASRSAAVAQLATARAVGGTQGGGAAAEGELLRTARGADVLVGHVVSLHSVQDVITVIFTAHALTMDVTTSAKLTADVRPLGEALTKANGHVSVRLSARGSAMQFSDNQRSAYIRLIAVRNALLQAGIAAADIDVHIDQITPSTDDSVTVALAPR